MMKNIKKVAQYFAVFLFGALTPVVAEDLVVWDVTTDEGAQRSPTNFAAVGSIMATNSQLTGSFPGGFTPGGFENNNLDDYGTYIEFSISPESSDQAIRYESISFAIFSSRTAGEFVLLASDDGFESSTTIITAALPTARITMDFAEVDLSFLGTTSETVAFRLAPYGVASGQNFGFMNNPSTYGPGGLNVSVQGTVIADPVAPQLGIAVGMESVVVRWPDVSGAWSLYRSDDLLEWDPVEIEPVVGESETGVEVPIVESDDSLYFRLEARNE